MNQKQLSEQKFVYHPSYGQCRIMSVGSTADNRITCVMLAPNDNPGEWVKVTDYELITVSKSVTSNDYQAMCKVYRDYVADYEGLAGLYGADYVEEYRKILAKSDPIKHTVSMNGFNSWQHRIHYITDGMAAIVLRQRLRHG